MLTADEKKEAKLGSVRLYGFGVVLWQKDGKL